MFKLDAQTEREVSRMEKLYHTTRRFKFEVFEINKHVLDDPEFSVKIFDTESDARQYADKCNRCSGDRKVHYYVREIVTVSPCVQCQ